MKKRGLIVVVMMSFIGCDAQPESKWQAWSVAAHAKDSFSAYLKKIPKEATEEVEDFIDLPAIVIPYQVGDTAFENPLKEAGLIECQCAFDKDTLTIAIGEGYYAGAAFMAKVYKRSATSSFIAWNEDSIFGAGSGKWQTEIEVSADKLELALSKKAPFIIDETIYGIWKVDYPMFQVKEDKNEIRNMTIRLKIYFSCKVDYEIQ